MPKKSDKIEDEKVKPEVEQEEAAEAIEPTESATETIEPDETSEPITETTETEMFDSVDSDIYLKNQKQV